MKRYNREDISLSLACKILGMTAEEHLYSSCNPYGDIAAKAVDDLMTDLKENNGAYQAGKLELLISRGENTPWRHKTDISDTSGAMDWIRANFISAWKQMVADTVRAMFEDYLENESCGGETGSGREVRHV